MRHTIETACPCTHREMVALQRLLAPFPTACVYELGEDHQPNWNIRINISNANGAELRDIVDTLDRAGMMG